LQQNLNMASTGSDSSQTVALTFEKETLHWRVYAAVIRGSVLQFLAVLTLSGLQSFAPWYPIHWLFLNLNVLFHPSSWFFDALIVACLVALASIYARSYQLASLPIKSLSSALRNLCRADVLLSLLVHAVAGGVLARCYLGLVGQRQYSTLTLPCSDVGIDRCINEAHVFLVVSGAFSGFCIWWDYHLKSGNCLRFQAIQQLGLEQVQGQLYQLNKEAISQVLLNLRWYYILYLVLGSKLENSLGDIVHMDMYSQGSNFSMSATLMKHLGIFLQCVTINILITVNVNLLRLIMNISLTQRVKFSMKSVTFASNRKDECSSVALLDALSVTENNSAAASAKSNSLMKYLAYQDFAYLAEDSPLRRADFYALSQPGGHPRNWTDLVKIFIKFIEDFARDLNESSKQSISITPSASEVAQARLNNKPPVSAVTAAAIQHAADKALAVAPITKIKPVQDNPAAAAGSSKPISAGAAAAAPPLLAASNVIGKGFKALTAKLNAIILDKFTITPTPDASVRFVYAESMPVIWAIKGMSHLITKSISEDRYGVVQKDLARILGTLLSLLQTLERFKGLTATARKNRFETRDLQLKQDLRVTLKAAIYRICVNFGDHIHALDLPVEHKMRLNNFQTFKEG